MKYGFFLIVYENKCDRVLSPLDGICNRLSIFILNALKYINRILIDRKVPAYSLINCMPVCALYTRIQKTEDKN